MKHRAVCWYAEGQTLEFWVELGEYFGVVWVVLACIPAPIAGATQPGAVRRGVLSPADPGREHR
jgi:hypothetical protein